MVELSFRAPFGVVLRALRKAAGWTQLQLAVEVHRDHTSVSKWEKGTLRPDAHEGSRRRNPARQMLFERCRIDEMGHAGDDERDRETPACP